MLLTCEQNKTFKGCAVCRIQHGLVGKGSDVWSVRSLNNVLQYAVWRKLHRVLAALIAGCTVHRPSRQSRVACARAEASSDLLGQNLGRHFAAGYALTRYVATSRAVELLTEDDVFFYT